jgi:Bacterial PH domain
VTPCSDTVGDVLARASISARTYRASVAPFAWLLLTATAIAATVGLLTVHPRHHSPDSLLTNEFVGAIVFSLCMAFFLQFAQCRVIAAPEGLTVIGTIRRNFYPWGAIADVRVAPDGGMRITLLDGTRERVAGFGGSLIATMTGGIYARKVRDGITQVMRAPDAQSEPAPITSSVQVHWKIFLGFLVANLALSFGGWLLAPNHVLT